MSEDMIRAARMMQSAADSMASAASNLQYAVDSAQRNSATFLEDLDRILNHDREERQETHKRNKQQEADNAT